METSPREARLGLPVTPSMIVLLKQYFMLASGKGFPALSVVVTCAAVGDEHHFVFYCAALTHAMDRYPQFFCNLSAGTSPIPGEVRWRIYRPKPIGTSPTHIDPLLNPRFKVNNEDALRISLVKGVNMKPFLMAYDFPRRRSSMTAN
jgi:hypothetical protein